MGGASTHTWGRLWPFTARGSVCWDCRGQGAGKVDGMQGMEDRYCELTGSCPGTIILVCSSKRGQAAIGATIKHHHSRLPFQARAGCYRCCDQAPSFPAAVLCNGRLL